MSIYDKASLVLIPSGTKTSKVYSQKPVNGDGDFTFSRSTAATRVNADGNIEKETQNLITQSNNFSNSDWTNSGITLTSGQSDPFGGSNGWRYLMTGTIGGSYLYQSNRTINASPMVLSFWVKSNTGSNQTFQATANSGSQASPAFTATTEWQRFSWFFVSSSGGSNILLAYNQSQNIDLVIYGAQLEQGLVARDYIETTTAAVEGGITDNVPRLDYTDSSCPALLLEPQRTNRVTNSEYLNGDWDVYRSTLIPNDDTSPEGVNNATKLQEDTTASNTHFTGKGYNYVSGTTYSWSVYVKPDGRDEVLIQQGNPAVISFNAVFNFTSETANNIGNGTARIEDAGNGWYRCIIEGTTALLSSGTNINVFLRSGGTTTYTGNGASGVLLYGFQLEEGSYATSYIPTYGTSVTRNEDACNAALSVNDINSQEGVLYTEISALYDVGNFELISLNDGTNDNRCAIFFNGGTLTTSYRVNQSNIFLNVNSSLDILQYHKVAISYKQNEFKAFVDGVKVLEQLSGDVAPANTFNELSFDRGGGSSKFIGRTKQVLTFNTALNDEELAALTTI